MVFLSAFVSITSFQGHMFYIICFFETELFVFYVLNDNS